MKTGGVINPFLQNQGFRNSLTVVRCYIYRHQWRVKKISFAVTGSAFKCSFPFVTMLMLSQVSPHVVELRWRTKDWTFQCFANWWGAGPSLIRIEHTNSSRNRKAYGQSLGRARVCFRSKRNDSCCLQSEGPSCTACWASKNGSYKSSQLEFLYRSFCSQHRI